MKNVFLFLVFALLTGCVSTHYSVHPNASLNDYRYVVIVKPEYDPYGIHGELSTLFWNAGFRIVSEAKKGEIPLHDRSKVLFCVYEYSSALMNIRANINLYDYAMDGTVFSGEGEYGLGMDRKNNAMRAIEQAFWGISEEYSQ
jgi:hypothetical protein